MKRIILVSIFIFSITPAFAQDQSYCQDKKAWNEWNELVQKYPHDMNIQMLHAVRIGLCKKIEKGTISFGIAREVFNQLHDTAYRKAKKEQSQLLKNKQL